jgi:hypothetical protein
MMVCRHQDYTARNVVIVNRHQVDTAVHYKER